ncbi:MAG: hypothetical protein AAF333_03420 [Planctomycetota bacterium]
MLVSLGILAIGITAVAALFPSGILMQKRAVKEALFQQNTRSAEALLTAKGIDAQTLFDFTDNISGRDSVNNRDIFTSWAPRSGNVSEPEFDVFALSEVDSFFVVGTGENNDRPNMIKGPTPYDESESLLSLWPESDRSFPTIESDIAAREFFFVPLIRRGPEATPYINDWVVYLFVLQAQPEVDDPVNAASTTPTLKKYPNEPDIAGYDNTIQVPNGAVCANPFDDEAFFPKVFRAEVDSWVNNRATLDNGNWDVENILRLGDLVLGDDGKIYRVGEVDESTNSVVLNESTRQEIDSIAISTGELGAFWFAMPPNSSERNPPSPIRDIRILSRKAVKLEDFQ